jgi:hypothetical protein
LVIDRECCWQLLGIFLRKQRQRFSFADQG